MLKLRGLSLLILALVVAPVAADGPAMENVVAAPQDYAGQTLVFNDAILSGAITKYDVAGVRKYYLSVESKNRVFEGGFFLAPPDVADALAPKMDPRKNYRVRLTCKIEKIVINSVPQWHGITTRVDFLSADEKVLDTVEQGKK
jgi:hypothetical protein